MGDASSPGDTPGSRESGATTAVKPGSSGIAARSGNRPIPLHRQILETVFPRAAPEVGDAPLDLEPGDWVEVRSIEEIVATLDGEGRHHGLFFMPGMERFCGERFRVLKPVRTIKLESTGEVRRIVEPTVLLEGVYCDGERHGGCDRACLHLWWEGWLECVQEPAPTPNASPAGP